MNRTIMKSILAVAFLAMSASAFATCPKGDNRPYPECLKPPVVTPDPPRQDQHQNQDQNQNQNQSQTSRNSNRNNNSNANNNSNRNSNRNNNSNANNNANNNAANSASNSAANATGGNSRSSATGGDSSSSSVAGVSGSGNSRSGSASDSNSGGNSFDASDRSSTSYANDTRINTFIPGDLPTNAMTIAPSAYITVAGDTTCGILQTLVETPVYQWDKRGKKKWQVGADQTLAPVYGPNNIQKLYDYVPRPGGGLYEVGSHVTYVLGTKGASNSSQLGLQGGGAGGYGGVSYGRGSAYSEGGSRMIIRSCLVRELIPAPVRKAAPRPVVRKKKAAVRRAPAPCQPRVCPVK